MSSTTSVVARAFAGVPAKARIKAYDWQALAQSRVRSSIPSASPFTTRNSAQSRAAIAARLNCNNLTKADVMKLVRMAGDRIGLFVLLPKGPYAIDIANSLGVFPHDPLSNGLLNGALKDGHDWSIIVEHWVHLRWPLKKLLSIALANPDTPRLVLQPLVDATGTASAANPIIAIEVTDIESVEEHDPTGWHAMHRQFALPPRNEAVRQSAADETVRVIDFTSIEQRRHPS